MPTTFTFANYLKDLADTYRGMDLETRLRLESTTFIQFSFDVY